MAPPTSRRGLTLLELLLAIGLVLMLGALVLPATFNGLRERTFESAGEVMRDQLLLARAHAQITRRPVEVTYESTPPRKPGVRARYFAADASGDAELERNPDRDSDPDLVIVEGWADRDLPDGLHVSGASESGEAPEAAPAASPDGDETPVVLRLAVYLPDGSAPLGEPAWLRDDHGRRGVIEVNAWTGLPSFRRVTAGDAGEDAAEADQPEGQEPEKAAEDFRPVPPAERPARAATPAPPGAGADQPPPDDQPPQGDAPPDDPEAEP